MLNLITGDGHRLRKRSKSLRDMLIDSGVVAAIAFLSALPPDRPPSLEDLYVALYAFAMSFAVQLAAYRGVHISRTA